MANNTTNSPTVIAIGTNPGQHGATTQGSTGQEPVGYQSTIGTSTHLDPERQHQEQYFSDVKEGTHPAKNSDGGFEWGYLQTNRGIDTRLSGDGTAVNNSETLVDQTPSVTIGKNRSYSFYGMIFYSSGTTPDMKLAFKDPSSSGASIRWGTAGGLYANAFATALVFDGTGAAASAWIFGTGTMGSTDGALTLQMAQNTADMSDTKLLVGSHLHVDLY